MTPREWRRHVRELAAEHGYTVTLSPGGHLRLDKPGRPVIFTSASSSDHRMWKNLRAEMRRAERVS